jgi:hypothetical protein
MTGVPYVTAYNSYDDDIAAIFLAT